MEKKNIIIKEYDISKSNKRLAKKKTSKKSMLNIIIVAAVIVLIIAAAYFISRKEVVHEEVIETNEVEKPIEKVEVYQDAREVIEPLEKEPPMYLQKYLEQNERTIGYIKIDDTQIDYPVVQTDNNDYYMTHNFNYDEDKAGCIFMDFRCDIDDFSKTRNIILYGHRMKDGSMFKGLIKYEDEDFFLKHQIIRFDTINEELEWEVFAVFETTTDFYYIDTEFPYEEMWIYFIEQCKEKSMHKSNVNLYADDIVLTLSTCSTSKDERFVVMAKLLK